MTLSRLLARNFLYHWRGNLAVLLGVAIGTAVLTGALLVGDSLRGSLRDRALAQLGWVDQALVAGRFFRAELADEVAKNSRTRLSPVLLLQGAVTAESLDAGRAGRVTIVGVDERFWDAGAIPMGPDFWRSTNAGIVLSATVAHELGVGAGDKIDLHFQRASAIPREFILGQQEAGEALGRVPLSVRAVLPGDSFGDRFSLTPSPVAPRNLFVPLRTLQRALLPSDRAKGPALGPDHPINGILAGGTGDLQGRLAAHLTLEDWGLVLRDPNTRARMFFDSLDRGRRGRLRLGEWARLTDRAFLTQIDRNGDGVVDRDEMVAYYRARHPYLVLESRRLFVEPAVAAAAKEAAAATGMREAPTLAYLVDSIASGGQDAAYALVAALDPTLPPPLGPFLPAGVDRLADDEIILIEGTGSPLPPDAGKVVLTYYDPEQQDRLRELGPLAIRGWLPLAGPADDPDLTPPFPGITDQSSLADWDPPPSMHYRPKRMRPADEAYWRSYRTTPKAYVTLALGQRLWGSRFGNLTSVRLAPAGGGPLAAGAADAFTRALLERLPPEQGGMMFGPVRARALAGSAGSQDFGGLFLGFSLFLIVAALLLVGLLFRLNLDRRGMEAGVLLATGLRRRTLRWLYLAEGGLLAAVGGLGGLAGAVLYAWLLLDLLRRWWPGGLDQSFLRLHLTGESFAIGYAASLVVSVLTIAWSVRMLGRVSPRALLAGETAEPPLTRARESRRWVLPCTATGMAIMALAGMAAGSAVRDPEARAGSFFGSGMMLLGAGMLAMLMLLRRESARPARHVATVGMRNAGRHPGRSVLTAGLLALATFLVVAVQSFRQEPGRDFASRDGGSGGFPLMGESDVPLFLDPQSRRGREELEGSLGPTGIAEGQRQQALAGVTMFPLRLRAGEDAGCLNLYQPGRPRLLGAPPALLERGGFHFQATLAQTAEQKENPWRLLGSEPDAQAPVPVFAEASAAEWVLHKNLGDTLSMPDEAGLPRQLRIVGLMKDSVFQGEVVMADSDFRRLYPHEEGYRFFLIETPPEREAEVKRLLERALADHGLTVTPTRERVEATLAVENTYLSTFQALGGLGVVLGALGLAVVLLRGVWERRGELALLRALGYRRVALGLLVLAENGSLLVLGVGVGTAAALVAVAPHLIAGTGAVPWMRLAGFLGLVLAVGLAAGAAAVMMTLRAPLLPALRRE